MESDTSNLLRGTLTTLVLSVLEREPLYGYEIAKEIRERTGGLLHLKEGSLYPSLHWMEREGFLSPKWMDAERGPRRKYYHLTRKGRTVLAKRRSTWQQFRDAVDTIVAAQPEGRQAR